MTLQRIQVFNGAFTTLIAELLVNPFSSQDGTSIIKQKGYIRNVTGLDPVAASIITADNGTTDGAVYQDGRVGKRNIVMTIGFEPNYALGETAKKLRQIWYGVLPPKQAVTLKFVDDVDPTCYIKGYVETHQADIFTDDPQSSISIINPLPYFLATSSTTLQLVDRVNTDPNYTGSAPTGFTMQSTVSQASGLYRIAADDDQDDLRINYAFKIGDHIQVSTVPKARYARVIRGTSNINLLDYVVGELDMTLNRTINKMAVTMWDGTKGKTSVNTLNFRTQHVGI